YPQGRQARRPAGRAVEQVRAGNQCPDRPDAWPRRTADAARPRRRGDRVTRREFNTLLGGIAAAWPLATRALAQKDKPLVGFLSSGSISGYRNLLRALRKGLAERGYVEGQNVVIEYRWAEGHFDRLPALAGDLVARGAAVIVTSGIGSALGVRAVNTSIPLVFLAGDDPVKFGLAASLNRPGGTATGVAWLTSELSVLINPKSPEVAPQLKEVEAAANALGQTLHIANASSEPDFDVAFATLVERRANALIVTNDPFFNSMRERIVALAARHRLPAIYDRREYTTAGGLFSYGTSYS